MTNQQRRWDGNGHDATLKALGDVRQGLQESLEAHRAALREYRTRCYLTCRGACSLCRQATALLGPAQAQQETEATDSPWEPLPWGEWWARALVIGIAIGLAAGLVMLAF